jgi:hypothetical protein
MSYPRIPGFALMALVLAGAAAAGFTRKGAIQEKGSPALAGLPLVQPATLVYRGSFRLPLGDEGDSTFAYGGTALAFNPARGSLFLVGHDWRQYVAEISVPDIRHRSSVAELATAAVLQPLSDVTEGKMKTLNPGDPNAKKIGGLLPYRGKLYVSAYSYYDGAGTQVLSHFVTGQDLSVKGDVDGPFRVGKEKAGFVSGYMTLVPAAWQAALGGPALTGQCCLAIVGRTSSGPAVFSVDPADIGVKNPAPATPLVYYPSETPLTSWGSTNPYYNGTTEVRGVVFPEGTRSVLFFGRHGLGPFCYGGGTKNEELKGKRMPDGVNNYCYDPQDDSKGTHGFPYAYYVWAYDAMDLAAVKGGHKRPWQVKPYAVWKLDFPFPAPGVRLNGAAYDGATGRIFLVQTYADGAKPLIHVYTADGRPSAPVAGRQ